MNETVQFRSSMFDLILDDNDNAFYLIKTVFSLFARGVDQYK